MEKLKAEETAKASHETGGFVPCILDMGRNLKIVEF
jgi:hypothetical protein